MPMRMLWVLRSCRGPGGLAHRKSHKLAVRAVSPTAMTKQPPDSVVSR
jgi:hypothetical protein